jgi:hypothetical protein
MLGAKRLDQLEWCAQGDDFSVIDDRDAVAEDLRFVHIVCGEQDRSAARLELRDQIPELPARLRIEPGGRLVEKEKIRIAHDCAGERNALALSSGQFPEACSTLLVELNETNDVVDSSAARIEAPKQSYRLFDRKLGGKLGFLKLNTKTLAKVLLVFIPAKAKELHVAGVRGEQPLANFDCRRLAGAVRSEQAEAFAGCDREVEPVHSANVAVVFVKIANEERGSSQLRWRHSREFYILLPDSAQDHSVERGSTGGRVIRAVLFSTTLGVALVLYPVTLVAQTQTGSISGTVRDSAGLRLDQVAIGVVSGDRTPRTQSSASGNYRISAIGAGKIRLFARRVGYAPETLSVVVIAGESTHADFIMASAVHELPEAIVVADPTRGKMGPFNQRKSRGVGAFVTRAEIEKRQPASISELLRYLPGVGVTQRMAGEPQPVHMQRSVNSSMQPSCVVQLYVDGHPYPNGNVDDFAPGLIEGVEVYRSASEIPADFRTRDAACGLIALWTRDPESARRKP